MGYEIKDKIWTPDQFDGYVEDLPKVSWAKGVTFHHTAFPDLEMRPGGLTAQHQKNLHHYYAVKKRWSDGPHLFTDDDSILGMSGLLDDGVHSVGFNRTHIGIEVLGNFDEEDPKSGRGLSCWTMAFYAAADILQWLGLPVNARTVTFHREDGHTRKTCPGRLVSKQWVMDGIRACWDKGPGELTLGAGKDTSKPDQDQKRPRVPGWDRWELVEGGWFVPIVDFMDHIGGNPSDIVRSLKREDGKLYYQGDVIENTFYNKDEQTTYALAKELLGFV